VSAPEQPPQDEPARARFPTRRVLALLVLQLVVVGVALAATTGHDQHDPHAVATGTPAARTHRFDASRALQTVRLQLAAGPRPAGSPALRRVASRLRRMLPGGRFEAVPSPAGADRGRLRNIVGELPGTGPAILLGAHYDTQPYPRGFVGANDAAAAVGTVIEVARALRRTRRPAGAPPVRFVLFDGEESPTEKTPDFYRDALRGSRAYAAAHASELQAMVLLDYIGNRDVRLPREGSSNPALWRRVRSAASAVGVGSVFPDATQATIFDDHTPFERAGVDAVDLIDWSYRPYDDQRDTYARLSGASIDAVGETIVELLSTWR
jgi:glutaminyl-peptide cyclotransferase